LARLNLLQRFYQSRFYDEYWSLWRFLPGGAWLTCTCLAFALAACFFGICSTFYILVIKLTFYFSQQSGSLVLHLPYSFFLNRNIAPISLTFPGVIHRLQYFAAPSSLISTQPIVVLMNFRIVHGLTGMVAGMFGLNEGLEN
jgi:hypothetical protein